MAGNRPHGERCSFRCRWCSYTLIVGIILVAYNSIVTLTPDTWMQTPFRVMKRAGNNTLPPDTSNTVHKQLVAKRYPQRKKGTLYIEANGVGGLGNKVYGMIPLLALARATNRKVVSYGKAVIWRQFWNSSIDILPGKPWVSKGTPNPLRLGKSDLEDPASPAWEHVFGTNGDGKDQQDLPPRDIVIRYEDHGQFLNLGSNPTFRKRYLEALQMDERTAEILSRATTHGDTKDFLSRASAHADTGVVLSNAARRVGDTDNQIGKLFEILMVVMEMPQVLHTPTTDFQEIIDDFIDKYALPRDPQQPLVDLALHIRKCVDCGWIMPDAQIQRNVQCVLDTFVHRMTARRLTNSTDAETDIVPLQVPTFDWNGTTIFLTTDDIAVVDIVRGMLPSGAVLIQEIPPEFVHTDRVANRKENFKSLATPYLDNYMLGRARIVASCFTTYGRMGIMRTSGIDGLHNVLQWQHFPESIRENVQFSEAGCIPMLQTLEV